MKHHLLIASAILALGLPHAALAQSQGEWTLGFGIANVNPKSDNGTLAGGTVPTEIGDSTRPTITVEYFFRDNLGIEVLGALLEKWMLYAVIDVQTFAGGRNGCQQPRFVAALRVFEQIAGAGQRFGNLQAVTVVEFNSDGTQFKYGRSKVGQSATVVIIPGLCQLLTASLPACRQFRWKARLARFCNQRQNIGNGA